MKNIIRLLILIHFIGSAYVVSMGPSHAYSLELLPGINELSLIIFNYDGSLGQCSKTFYDRSALYAQYLKFKFGIEESVANHVLNSRPHIQHLDLGYNRHIVPILIKALEANKCFYLKSLNLIGTDPTGKQVQSILELRNTLRVVNLRYCKDAALGIVAALKNKCGYELQDIDLRHTNSKAEEIEIILKNCQKLIKLDLFECINVASGIVNALQNGYGRGLKSLNLGATNTTYDQVEAILRNCPNLTDLTLKDCIDADIGIVNALQDGCGKHLKSLDLSATNAAPEQIEVILRKCRNLTELKIKSCEDSGIGIINALRDGHGKQLKKLDLGFTNATSEQIEEILRNCCNLTDLSVRGCYNCLTRIIAALQDNYGQLLQNLDLKFTDPNNIQIITIKELLLTCKIDIE